MYSATPIDQFMAGFASLKLLRIVSYKSIVSRGQTIFFHFNLVVHGQKKRKKCFGHAHETIIKK